MLLLLIDVKTHFHFETFWVCINKSQFSIDNHLQFFFSMATIIQYISELWLRFSAYMSMPKFHSHPPNTLFLLATFRLYALIRDCQDNLYLFVIISSNL